MNCYNQSVPIFFIFVTTEYGSDSFRKPFNLFSSLFQVVDYVPFAVSPSYMALVFNDGIMSSVVEFRWWLVFQPNMWVLFGVLLLLAASGVTRVWRRYTESLYIALNFTSNVFTVLFPILIMNHLIMVHKYPSGLESFDDDFPTTKLVVRAHPIFKDIIDQHPHLKDSQNRIIYLHSYSEMIDKVKHSKDYMMFSSKQRAVESSTKIRGVYMVTLNEVNAPPGFVTSLVRRNSRLRYRIFHAFVYLWDCGIMQAELAKLRSYEKPLPKTVPVTNPIGMNAMFYVFQLGVVKCMMAMMVFAVEFSCNPVVHDNVW